MKKQLRIKVAKEFNKYFGAELFNEKHLKKIKLISKFYAGGPKYHNDIYAMQMSNLTLMAYINGDNIIVHSQEW